MKWYLQVILDKVCATLRLNLGAGPVANKGLDSCLNIVSRSCITQPH